MNRYDIAQGKDNIVEVIFSHTEARKRLKMSMVDRLYPPSLTTSTIN